MRCSICWANLWDTSSLGSRTVVPVRMSPSWFDEYLFSVGAVERDNGSAVSAEKQRLYVHHLPRTTAGLQTNQCWAATTVSR